MKKVMSVLALCGLLALSGGSAFAAQWKLAHIRPSDSVIERDLQAFAKEVRIKMIYACFLYGMY